MQHEKIDNTLRTCLRCLSGRDSADFVFGSGCVGIIAILRGATVITKMADITWGV